MIIRLDGRLNVRFGTRPYLIFWSFYKNKVTVKVICFSSVTGVSGEHRVLYRLQYKVNHLRKLRTQIGQINGRLNSIRFKVD
jgi:hypothetical protein